MGVEEHFAIPELKNWKDLVERLRQYSLAVSRLGGLNNLDSALLMAADGLEMYVPKDEYEKVGEQS